MGDEAAAAARPRTHRGAADYLAAAMIYLRDNVLLTEPLRPEHLKPRPLGHWGPVDRAGAMAGAGDDWITDWSWS